jgi:hypothetical protein
MKTLDEIRAELEEQLRARQGEVNLIRAALAAMESPQAALDELDAAYDELLSGGAGEAGWLPPPVKLSDVQVPEAEAQRVHDELDHEAHGGEKSHSEALTTKARDAILIVKTNKGGVVTVETLQAQLECSKTWARVQLRAAEAKGMVEQIGEFERGKTMEFRYVVPSAQAAARSRHAVKSRRDRAVPGTGRQSNDTKNKRELKKIAKDAGVPVTETKGGHTKIGNRTVSKTGSGRRRANVEAEIRRQASAS